MTEVSLAHHILTFRKPTTLLAILAVFFSAGTGVMADFEMISPRTEHGAVFCVNPETGQAQVLSPEGKRS